MTSSSVILLSIDALRADHCSYQGYERETTPVLDRLAETELAFTHAISASSHTREAVPALLTGRYPDEATDSSYNLATDTIAPRLSESGFRTAGFHSNPFVSRAYGFDRGFDTFDDDLRLGSHRFVALAQRLLDKLRNRHYARAGTINDRSFDWLDSIDNQDRPFFCWNHYMDVHGPYEPFEDYRELFHDEPVSDREAQRLYKRSIRDPESITTEERETLIDLYDAELRYTDEQIGVLLDRLDARGLLDDTLVIITADHGDAFGEHGYYEHPRYLHDGLVHVPLIVRHPANAGKTCDEPVSTLDVVPTVLDYVGRLDSTLPGRSLLDIANDPESFVDRRIFSQVRGRKENEHLRRFRAFSADDHHSITYDTNLERMDDDEPATRTTLENDLREHVTHRLETVDRDQATDDGSASEEVESRLEALGYKQ